MNLVCMLLSGFLGYGLFTLSIIFLSYVIVECMYFYMKVLVDLRNLFVCLLSPTSMDCMDFACRY